MAAVGEEINNFPGYSVDVSLGSGRSDLKMLRAKIYDAVMLDFITSLVIIRLLSSSDDEQVAAIFR